MRLRLRNDLVSCIQLWPFRSPPPLFFVCLFLFFNKLAITTAPLLEIGTTTFRKTRWIPVVRNPNRFSCLAVAQQPCVSFLMCFHYREGRDTVRKMLCIWSPSRQKTTKTNCIFTSWFRNIWSRQRRWSCVFYEYVIHEIGQLCRFVSHKLI